MVLNGPGHLDERQRYVGNMNLSFAYVEGESLIMGLKVRSSACCCSEVHVEKEWMIDVSVSSSFGVLRIVSCGACGAGC